MGPGALCVSKVRVVVAMEVVFVFVCVLGKWAYQDGEGCRAAFSMGRAGVEKKGTLRTLRMLRTL